MREIIEKYIKSNFKQNESPSLILFEVFNVFGRTEHSIKFNQNYEKEWWLNFKKNNEEHNKNENE